MSPTYSPRSPAYTPTSSGAGIGRSGTSSARSGIMSSSPAYAPKSSRGSKQVSSPGGDLKRRTSPAWSPTYSPSTGSAAQMRQAAYEPSSMLTSPAYTPMSPQYTPTSPLYTPTSPGMDVGLSPLTSPKVTDMDVMESPGLVGEAELAGGSPVMQMLAPESPEVPTSPSYTPHQGRATGDHTSECVRGAALPSGAGLTDVQEGDDAQSSLFEASDDEQEVEPTYSPPSPADFASTAAGTAAASADVGTTGPAGRSSAASEYVRASTEPTVPATAGGGAGSGGTRLGSSSTSQVRLEGPTAYSPTSPAPGDGELD